MIHILNVIAINLLRADENKKMTIFVFGIWHSINLIKYNSYHNDFYINGGLANNEEYSDAYGFK